MVRQYRIVTKTHDTEEQMLTPGVHAGLYNIPEIRDSVLFLEQQPNVEMIGIRISTRFYGIVVVYDSEPLPNHFTLQDLQ
jgi:hypothetical protein